MLPKRLSNKALAVTGLTAGALFLGISLTQANQVHPIGLEKAKAIALADAQAKADKVHFISAEVDDDRKVYDIEFYDGNKEYDYEIAISDGRILERDFDVEYFNSVRETKVSTTSSSSSKSRTQATTPSSSQTGISDSKAKDIALSDAKLTEKSVTNLKIESERDDDDEQVYNVEFYDPATNREYDYSIDCQTGRILDIDDDMESYTARPTLPTPSRSNDADDDKNQAPVAQTPAPSPASAPVVTPSPAPRSQPVTPAAPVYQDDDDWDDDWNDDWNDDDWDDDAWGDD